MLTISIKDKDEEKTLPVGEGSRLMKETNPRAVVVAVHVIPGVFD
jgi:hypothetical protein